jgi:nitrite reductase/ring-hydroxylating ferredoxin subunit/uncharacterized membrane protein
MKRLPLLKPIDKLEDAAVLDPAVSAVKKGVDRVIRPQWLRDVLHGVPIGHALHPLMILAPAGAWLSVAGLDLVPGTERASRLLVGAGVVSALPTAAAGFTDWSRLHAQQQRVGIVHSVANLLATGLYAASYVQRRRGKQLSGKLLGYAGLALISGGGYLGGHLSYAMASGANHAEDVPHLVPEGWQPLVPLDEVPQRTLQQRYVGDVPVLLHRNGDRVSALSAKCSHLSGPLAEGTLLEGGNPCVVCPWHGSVFEIETGEVVHGPATAPQHRFDTRVVDGMIEVSLPR